MFSKLKILLTIFILFELISCKIDYKTNRIIGQYTFDTITFNDTNVKGELITNTIIFEKNNQIYLPNNINESNEKKANWSIIEGDLIKIESSNKIFNGNYKFKYIYDNLKKRHGIELKSKTTQLTIHKLLPSY